jgi:hypothetical protein
MAALHIRSRSVRSAAAQGPLDVSHLYTPFKRQRQFHKSRAKYRLFGGAAGPGKTKALLWEAIYQAHQVPSLTRVVRG